MAAEDEIAFTEKQRNYLLKIADALTFIEDDEVLHKYKCCSCNKIAIRNNMSKCKHVFCSDCIISLFQKHDVCPVCKDFEIIEIKTGLGLDDALLDLKVACPHTKHGCQEKITLRNYQEHEIKCKFYTEASLPRLYNGKISADQFLKMEEDLQKMKAAIKEICDKESAEINSRRIAFLPYYLNAFKATKALFYKNHIGGVPAIESKDNYYVLLWPTESELCYTLDFADKTATMLEFEYVLTRSGGYADLNVYSEAIEDPIAVAQLNETSWTKTRVPVTAAPTGMQDICIVIKKRSACDVHLKSIQFFEETTK